MDNWHSQQYNNGGYQKQQNYNNHNNNNYNMSNFDVSFGNVEPGYPSELKVSSTSHPRSVAGSVAHCVRKKFYPEVSV
eukprot:Awhi_evm2s10372